MKTRPTLPLWKLRLREDYEAVQLTTPDEMRENYYSQFLTEEIAREALSEIGRETVAALRARLKEKEPMPAPEAMPTPTHGLAIEPETLYSRQMLIKALGMSRRMVDSISYTAIRRGWYKGADILAALNLRQAESKRARQARHPVEFHEAGRRTNGRG